MRTPESIEVEVRKKAAALSVVNEDSLHKFWMIEVDKYFKEVNEVHVADMIKLATNFREMLEAPDGKTKLYLLFKEDRVQRVVGMLHSFIREAQATKFWKSL